MRVIAACLALSPVLWGCNRSNNVPANHAGSTAHTGSVVPQNPQNSSNAQQGSVDVAMITLHDVASAYRADPVAAARHAVSWKLSNGQVGDGVHANVKYSFTLGHLGAVVLQVPGTSQTYYIVACEAKAGTRWSCTGFASCPVAPWTTPSGLPSPYSGLDTCTMTASNGTTYHVFDDAKTIIFLGTAKLSPGALPPGRTVNLDGGRKAVEVPQGENAVLYAVDNGRLLFAAGNLPASELERVFSAMAPSL